MEQETITPQESEEKSGYVTECLGLIENIKEQLFADIEAAEIDAELKLEIIKTIREHFDQTNFTDYSNASCIRQVMLENKIFDVINEFKFNAIGKNESYRYLGNEPEIVRNKISPKLYELGLSLMKAEATRNANPQKRS